MDHERAGASRRPLASRIADAKNTDPRSSRSSSTAPRNAVDRSAEPRSPEDRTEQGCTEQDRTEQARRESRAIAAAWISFVIGGIAGALALAGPPRSIAHADPSVALPAAAIAAAVTGGMFLVSTLLHRRHETTPMPPWQTVVANVSTAALTIAFGAVAALGVLTAAEILALGLQGLELPALGGGLLIGIACATGGWLAFLAGVDLRTRDLATLLFCFLAIGTTFSMLTAADPRWWERHFSELGTGAGAWAFNGTLVIAGLLVATIGAYIGRDLHRWLGDPALRRIAIVVALFALTGAALAAVGLFPVHEARLIHNAAALGTLLLFAATAVVVTLVMPGPPRSMLLTTIGAGIGLVVATLLWRPGAVYSIAGLEATAVGIIFVWLTTLVRVLGAGAPDVSRPSRQHSLLFGRERDDLVLGTADAAMPGQGATASGAAESGRAEAGAEEAGATEAGATEAGATEAGAAESGTVES